MEEVNAISFTGERGRGAEGRVIRQGGEALLPQSHSLAQKETEIREVQGEEFLSELVLLSRHLSVSNPPTPPSDPTPRSRVTS